MAYDVLKALQETTRRKILLRLAPGPKSVAAITEGVKAARIDRSRGAVSRAAISQHLKVLLQAELVSYSVEGSRHIYRLRRDGLEELQEYVERLLKAAAMD